MNIVTQPWYQGLCKAAQLTAEDVLSLVLQASATPDSEGTTREDFATQHEFYDALNSAFGDDEDEGLEFDWNINLSLLWICGLRPHIADTEIGQVLTWRHSEAYNPELTFKQAYMAVTVRLQELWLGDVTYCQRSFLTILEKLAITHKIWRSETAAENLFVIETQVIPNQPFFE
ncbi:hypothetical protein BIZ78_gp071 [Erwinia phage vB_EamM_Caitlin]|uniref:hypothetical protein n=1 Tax=Erwinia phage vB_EamM_Caitlin TaxID=1883379 RepID=UPI00081C3BF7|nr:hypothetical protein BIZ78_gp071 [Erwinia phage vB_EamM_Caitlin]ANZ48504.1 hypothetical protein CAITLIN_209 [Erwinia phage vB_EamM_Caitlin]